MKSLAGKTVVITGAGSGIGRKMAVICARENANLAILDINDKNLKDTEAEIKGLSARVHAYRCDVSRKDDIEKAVEAIKKDFQAIDVLINNAGIVNGKSLIDSSFDDIKRTIDINLMGVIWMTKCFLPEMVKRNKGHIVNIASAGGLLALPRLADYCATKFAVVGFSDSLRMEMKKFGSKGVKVTCVCPSIIDTGMFKGFKAPFLNPILDPDDVAEKIILAMKKDRSYLKLPFMVKLIPFLKSFPAAFTDLLGDILGTSRGMDHFQGRKP